MNEFVDVWLFDPTVGRLVAAVVTVLLVFVLVRAFHRMLGRRVKDTDVRYRSRKFVTFTGYLIALVAITLIFSDRLAGLTVAFGLAGAGIAFALQEVITSVAGWFAISFGGVFKPGHRVQLGGIRGDVIDIGILRTTVMEVGDWVRGDLYNGRVVRVANSAVFKEPVFNYSGEFPFLWDEIVVPIGFGSDSSLAREILSRVAGELLGGYADSARESWGHLVERYRIEDARVDPMISLIANENWMEFTIRYVVDYKMRRGTKDKLFTRIMDEVDRTAGRVVLASSGFDITKFPRLEVDLGNAGQIGVPEPDPSGGAEPKS